MTAPHRSADDVVSTASPNGVATPKVDAESPADGRGERETSELLEALAASPRRRRWPAALGGLVLGAAGMYFGLPYLDADDESGDVVAVVRDLDSVTVDQTDLVWVNEFSGDLEHGETFAIKPPGAGVVTSVAAPGTVLERGDILGEVDGIPLHVWYGELPAWRSLGDTSTPGADIRQLEENLVLLGYDEDGVIDVDDEYLWGTTSAVYNFEERFGRELTGQVEQSSVVFVPGPVVVDTSVGVGNSVSSGGQFATVTVLGASATATSPAGVVADLAPIGATVDEQTVIFTIDGVAVTADQAGIAPGSTIDEHHVSDGAELTRAGVVLTASATAQRITLDVPANDIDDFAVGDVVDVEFPDGSMTEAVLDSIATVAELAQGQGDVEATLEVTYVITGEVATLIGGGPVTIQALDREVRDAVVVPVRALVTLEDGSHAVEVVRDAATRDTQLVQVETGEFQDGLVQILGAVDPGDSVVVP